MSLRDTERVMGLKPSSETSAVEVEGEGDSSEGDAGVGGEGAPSVSVSSSEEEETSRHTRAVRKEAPMLADGDKSREEMSFLEVRREREEVVSETASVLSLVWRVSSYLRSSPSLVSKNFPSLVID